MALYKPFGLLTQGIQLLFEDQDLKLRRVTVKVRNEWPIEKKIECVTKYLALGNARLVSELTGVHYPTLKEWTKTSWWEELANEIKATRRITQDSKLSQIVDKALDTIADRLENGDVVVNNKTGDLMRRPVALRDANNTANTLMQRQAILEKMSNKSETADTHKTIQEQLSILAGEFAKFNNRSKAKAETIEYQDVVTSSDEGELLSPI